MPEGEMAREAGLPDAFAPRLRSRASSETQTLVHRKSPGGLSLIRVGLGCCRQRVEESEESGLARNTST